VVVSIIGILAALLVGGMGKAAESARATASVQQLRQVGVGIQLYASENDLRLPGPTWTTIRPRFRAADSNQLPTQIAPYMGYTVSDNWQVMDEMLFKSWAPYVGDYDPKSESIRTLMSNWNDYDRNLMNSRPLGYPGSSEWSTGPHRLPSLSEQDKLWLVKELPFTKAGKTIYPTNGKRLFLFLSGRVSLEEPDYFVYRK
jgi:hypothetical protein